MSSRKSSSSKCYWIVLLAFAAFSLWLRTGFPVYAIGYALHDDMLFVRIARFVEAGQWLGPYDNLTLAKGMFYPIFMVLAHWAAVPLKVAEQLVYLAVCALTAGAVRRFTNTNRFPLVLFALLAFNPVPWNIALARVIRQGLYMSLSLAVITLVVIIAFPIAQTAGSFWYRNVLPGISLGLLTTGYWLTREEGIWLLPAAVVIIAVALLGILRPSWALSDGEMFADRSTHFKAILLPFVIALATFALADGAIAARNFHDYGIFETNEMRARSFVRAYGAISRIQHDHWRPFITFPKDARERAYSVSSAARELKPYLEGATGTRWLQITCNSGGEKPCDEVQAGWAMWEFRDAVADAGHYRTGADAMKFYDTLADQINGACDAGTIPCMPPRATMQPPFRREYLQWTINTAKLIVPIVFRMVDGPIGSGPSIGSTEQLALFSDTLDGVYLPERTTIVVNGWAAAAPAAPSLKVEARTADPFESSITVSPAPDVLAAYPNLKSMRFELRTDCPVSSCDLVLDIVGAGQSRLPLSRLVQPGLISGFSPVPGLMIYPDRVAGLDVFRLQDARRSRQVKIAALMTSAYAKLIPWMAAVAAVGLLLATFFRRRFPLPIALLALGLASTAAVATLIVLMSYLMASSGFNVANVLYTSAASPFLITFTVLGLYSWYVALESWALRSGRQVAPPDFHVR